MNVDLETMKRMLDAVKMYEIAWKAAYEAGEKTEEIEEMNERYREVFDSLRDLIVEADDQAMIAYTKLQIVEFGKVFGLALAVLATKRLG